MRTVTLLPDEVTIKASRLRELERAERGHTVYLRAMRRHRVQERECRCMIAFAELILEENRNDH